MKDGRSRKSLSLKQGKRERVKKSKKKYEEKKKKLMSKFEKTLKRETTSVSHLTHQQTQGLWGFKMEAVSLLNLGPKFALTPKEISKMDIIQEVEKAALSLTRLGKHAEAEDLRHHTTNILLNARPPPSNLTSQQKKGLSFLNENKNITPFDKGQGLVTLEKEKLVEKAEAEFKNVFRDTPDTTNSYERKIQAKLRKLYKESKIDEKTKKQLYPSGSTTTSV
jgi:hypothetical protein